MFGVGGIYKPQRQGSRSVYKQSGSFNNFRPKEGSMSMHRKKITFKVKADKENKTKTSKTAKEEDDPNFDPFSARF